MSLRRSISGSGARSINRTSKPGVERLDERIVPDTTGTIVDPNSTVPAQTSTTTGTGTQTGTSSTTSTGTTTTTVTSTDPNGSTTTTTTTTDPITPPPVQLYAVSVDGGNTSRVIIYDNTGAVKYNLTPYGSFLGGTHAAVGDLTGDGVPDIVTGPGAGRATTLNVFDGETGIKILSFDAYDKTFRGGVNVAIGDIDGDGRADIVTGAGDTGGSHVKVFSGASLFPSDAEAAANVAPGPHAYLIREFFAYDAKYAVGARVAVADVNGDGRKDIITAPGNTAGPHIRVFSGVDGTIYREFFAYDANFRGGVYVNAGDLNGDGRAEIVTGMGANGVGEVKVFDGFTNRTRTAFQPTGAGLRISSRIGIIDYDRDGDLDILTGDLNSINAYDGKTYSRIGGMTPFDPSHVGGVFFG